MNKKAVLTKDLFNCDIPHIKDFFDKYEYPWEMLPHIKELIKELLEMNRQYITGSFLFMKNYSHEKRKTSYDRRN